MFSFRVLPNVFNRPRHSILRVFVSLLTYSLLQGRAAFMRSKRYSFVVSDVLRNMFIGRKTGLNVNILYQGGLPAHVLQLLLSR